MEKKKEIYEASMVTHRIGRAAGLAHTISPHKLRHFLLTWLKKQGIDDARVQPYSGHASRQALEIYSKLALVDAQREYNPDRPFFNLKTQPVTSKAAI